MTEKNCFVLTKHQYGPRTTRIAILDKSQVLLLNGSDLSRLLRRRDNPLAPIKFQQKKRQYNANSLRHNNNCKTNRNRSAKQQVHLLLSGSVRI